MVVEDDIELRTVIVTILGDLGYQVLEAASAASALAQLGQGENINLLISDIILPGGLGGKGLVAKATDLHPDLKSLFVSGYAENAAAHQSRLADGAALLVKPFGRRDLALKVREILDS
jgi:CheY-like chemotaxis protein